jgi:cobalt-zinc-cadmium efflux system membrane fusion protein
MEMAEDTTASTAEEGVYELSAKQFESSGMELGQMEIKTFHEVVKANGIIDVPPEYRASVSSYFSGTVKDIRLITGEEVQKGQLLFTLENPDFVQMQQDFLEAKGQLSYLKSDYDRQKNLAEDSVSSQKKFLKAESDYTVTKVKMESIAKKLALMNIDPNSLTMENIQTTIRVNAPIGGFVTRVGISRGSFLSPSESAVDIVNTEHLHLELNVFEKDLPKIKVGQTIQFRIQEDRSREYEAEVHLVNKTVDPVHRTIGIHGHLMDEETAARLSPGMYIESEIYAASVSKAALPEEALVEIDGKYYALVVQGNSNEDYSLEQTEISAGESNDGFVEILNPQDFNENTQFLVKGAFNLITE